MSKTVLVTGSSSGIGRATVEAFAEAGWKVAATSRNPKKENFKGLTNVATYKLDVTDSTSIDKAFQEVLKQHKKIDAVVNNAGYGLNGIFEAMNEAQIKKQFETNVFGLMNVTRAAITSMRPNKGGTIIQISSMGGRVTFPLYSVYHSSKWAVEGFSESLQYELKQFGIRIKIIEPGSIKTDFYGRSRTFVKPESSMGYDGFVSKVESVSQRSGKSGEDPRLVARTILKAANDSSNKLRYPVGSPAPVLLQARKLLPERLFYFVIKRIYKV